MGYSNYSHAYGQICKKAAHFEKKLKTWNFEVFGNIQQNVKKAEDSVLTAEAFYD